ncbi:MAG TPA: hypothetical protein VFA00_10750 [Actinomycetota bacterium]|jgi:hypothetical protein|nr:hypothetical protein [Actinomycetota bacterium]
MNGTKTLAIASKGSAEMNAIPLEDVFVSNDLNGDVAHVAYDGKSGIRWKEVSREDGELLATLGARSHIHLRSAARTGMTLRPSGVIGPRETAETTSYGVVVISRRRSA